jgi:REP element-mobilizing transposase RayT
MGGIAREHQFKALAIGGTEDHAHLLLSLPPPMSISTSMREIKSGSSRWMHENASQPQFGWQEGYGAFSIGQTQIDTTVAYIARQNEHHRKQDYQAEFLSFLKKHRIEYDPAFIWR